MQYINIYNKETTMINERVFFLLQETNFWIKSNPNSYHSLGYVLKYSFSKKLGTIFIISRIRTCPTQKFNIEFSRNLYKGAIITFAS